MRLGISLLLLPAVCVVAQSPGVPDWQTAAGGKMAFEVASVKPAKLPSPRLPSFSLDSGDAKPPGGRFSGTFGLGTYIRFAYKLPSSDKVVQLPNWDTFFEIDARAAGNPTKDQMRLMMRSLLADRFKLAVHFENREGPVLALTLAKPGQAGPKLHPHAEGPPCPEKFDLNEMLTPGPPGRAGEVFPPVCGNGLTRGTPNGTLIGSRNTTMGSLADTIYTYASLAGEVDKPVVDQTGLSGTYDFTLQLTGRLISAGPAGPTNPDSPPPDPQGTSFLGAVREQLGLKLVPAKGMIRTLVVDHVEQPSPN